MTQILAYISLVVRDYDEAITYYTTVLGFNLVEDSARERGKRWVVVAPNGGGTAFLLARAATPDQERAIGNQAGGRVFLFLHTDDFRRDYEMLRRRGVQFSEQPRDEEYGRVAVFRDIYGNKWDLIEPNNSVRQAPRHT